MRLLLVPPEAQEHAVLGAPHPRTGKRSGVNGSVAATLWSLRMTMNQAEFSQRLSVQSLPWSRRRLWSDSPWWVKMCMIIWLLDMAWVIYAGS